jgi:hypothetical protein
MAEAAVAEAEAPAETPTETPAEAPVEAEAEAQPKWPEDWREQLAGENDKELKHLQKYGAPQDIWKKARALEQKISSGEYTVALPEDPTEEEVAEYRKVRGIPEKPDGYDLSSEEGLAIGETDKPVVDRFLEVAHKRNMEPAQVTDSIKWYYEEIERQGQEREERDEQLKQTTEDELRGEWGKDYRRELNIVRNFLATAPEAVRDEIAGARMADGTPLGSHPEFIKWVNHLGRQANPSGTLTGMEPGETVKSIDGRMTEIMEVKRNDPKRYHRENLSAEYTELVRKKEALEG